MNLVKQKIFDQSISAADYSLKPQFDALTSLRFVACAMVVVSHLAPNIPGADFVQKWQLDQGVTFFFVLSGFILTCVYPKLDNIVKVKQFLLARLGRIWPSHLVMILATLILFPKFCASAAVFWTHIFLVQAWVPRAEYYFGLNAVAWSISVEAFFYLSFIWLIKPWKFGWVGKLLVGISLVLVACLVAQLFSISSEHTYLKFTEQFLIKINPLTRLFEFVLGMATAKLSLHSKFLKYLNKWQITLIELLIIVAIAIEITQIQNFIAVLASQKYLSLYYWLAYGGSAPLFALLIFLIASKQGYIAKGLDNTALIWLGERSYSTYMLHWLVLQSLIMYTSEFRGLPMYITYLVLIILLSDLNFNLVENPCRKLTKKIASSAVEAHNIIGFFVTGLRSSWTSILLIFVLFAVSGVYIQKSQDRFRYVDLALNKDITFRNNFLLERVSIANAKDGAKIRLTWRSLVTQTLNRTVAINFIDSSNNMLAQYEQQDIFHPLIKSGQSWSETIYAPASEINQKKWISIGLRICEHTIDGQHHMISKWLSVNNGQTDWWNTRLLLPLAKIYL